MPIPTLPLREHYGEWWNYIGYVLVERLRDSKLKYLNSVQDSQIIYGFTEEPLNYPNIYVIPISEGGSTPTTSGDTIMASFVYWVLIEDRSENLIKTDDNIRLIVGDILAEILQDRNLMYNDIRTALDTFITTIDADYLPSEEDVSIMRYHRIILTVTRKLDLSTVTE